MYMSPNSAQEERIEAALNSLEGIVPAIPAPFLYTRVRSRMEEEGVLQGWGRVVVFLSRPAIVFTLALLLLLTNSVVLFNRPESADNVEASVPVVAAEYALQTGIHFDYAAETP